MTPKEMMQKLDLDEREVRLRRTFFEIGDDDLARLAKLRPMAEKWSDEIVDELYELLLVHEESRRFFADDATVRRVKAAQKRYFLGLFEGRCDLAYVEDRLRVGAAHERVGLPTKWYLGAYARYLRSTMKRLLAASSSTDAHAAFESIQKLVYFDMALAVDSYIAASLATLARHQSAIRELSTPAIRVHDGILLLPLIGTIDTARANQVMETILKRVSDEHAQVVILDIAGVPTVDTKVADHLIQTTAAVRLLGATTILTGIRAEVSRTLVQLGVDVSSMDTRARLGEGIELALSRVGKVIRRRGKKR
jgi:rsbT co-antagonist protein RsbR